MLSVRGALSFTSDYKYILTTIAGDNSVAIFGADEKTGLLTKKLVLPVSGEMLHDADHIVRSHPGDTQPDKLLRFGHAGGKTPFIHKVGFFIRNVRHGGEIAVQPQGPQEKVLLLRIRSDGFVPAGGIHPARRAELFLPVRT